MDLRPGRFYRSKKNVLFKILPDPKNPKNPWVSADKSKILAQLMDGSDTKHWVPLTYDGFERLVGRPTLPKCEWWAGARKFNERMDSLRKLLKKNFSENTAYSHHRFAYFQKGGLVGYGTAPFALFRNGRLLYKLDVAFEEKLKAKSILSVSGEKTRFQKIIMLAEVEKNKNWDFLEAALLTHREWPK